MMEMLSVYIKATSKLKRDLEIMIDSKFTFTDNNACCAKWDHGSGNIYIIST